MCLTFNWCDLILIGHVEVVRVISRFAFFVGQSPEFCDPYCSILSLPELSDQIYTPPTTCCLLCFCGCCYTQLPTLLFCLCFDVGDKPFTAFLQPLTHLCLIKADLEIWLIWVDYFGLIVVLGFLPDLQFANWAHFLMFRLIWQAG